MSKLHYGKEPADAFVEGRRGNSKCTSGVHLVKMHAAPEAATAANLQAFLNHDFYPLKECYSKKGDCGPIFQECIDLVSVMCQYCQSNIPPLTFLFRKGLFQLL